MDYIIKLTPALCRAARGLVDISQVDLAAACNISYKTVYRYEGELKPNQRPATILMLQRELEARGVVFLDDGVLLRSLVA